MKRTLGTLKHTKTLPRANLMKNIRKVRHRFKRQRLAVKGNDPFKEVRAMDDKECYDYYAYT